MGSPVDPADRAMGDGGALSAVVAVPVCNERDRIADCLRALFDQRDVVAGSFGILLFLNNCNDGTREVVEGLSANAAVPVRILDEEFDGATAGWARRRAMDAAAAWLDAEGATAGVLLTSDADSRVCPDWLSRNMQCIAAGAHAVAGRITLDPADAAKLPAALHARGRLEADYEALLTEIDAWIAPQPDNPWPCHREKSGASIAIRLSTYRLIGGVPDRPLGEDRAMIDAVCSRGLPVRHDPGIIVTTSGRLDGRATGGCADTMKLRCDHPDAPCDDKLERLPRAVTRLVARRLLRDSPAANALARMEANSSWLGYQPLRPHQLPSQIRLARILLSGVRLGEKFGRGSRRAAPVGVVSPVLGETTTR